MITETLPRADAAERRYLGAVLRYPERADELLPLLDPKDCFDQFIQKALAHLNVQHRNGGVDINRARRELQVPESSSGDLTRDYFDDLKDEVCTSVHAPADAAEIKEQRRKRDRYDHHHTMALHALNGGTSEQIDQENEAALFDWKREREATKPQDTFTYAELRAKYPTLREPLIDGLMRVGETANIIANPKVGKSWFTYYLAMCVITGRSLFGKFETTSRDVLIVDNELHRETASYRLPAVARAMGIDDDKLSHHLVMKFLRGSLRSFEDVAAELQDQYEPDQFGLIIFDAKYRFAKPGESENDNNPEFYNAADCFASDMQSGLAFVHHSAKGSQSEKRISDIGAGGGVQSRAADCHAILREHEQEGVHVFEALVRSFPPVPAIPVRWQWPLFVPDLNIDPKQLKDKQTRGQQRQCETDKAGMDETVKALRNGPAGLNETMRRTGFGKDRQRRLLNKLLASGDVTFMEETKEGNKCHLYTLVE